MLVKRSFILLSSLTCLFLETATAGSNPESSSSSSASCADSRSCLGHTQQDTQHENVKNHIDDNNAMTPSALLTTPPTPNQFRNVPWNSLPPSKKSAAGILGYTEFTWNYQFLNPIEKLSYESIGENHSSLQQSAIRALGFTKEQWNCHVNHHTDVDWIELQSNGLQSHYMTLGYNQDSWATKKENRKKSSSQPPSIKSLWNDLSETERAAAELLCHSETSWNKVARSLLA